MGRHKINLPVEQIISEYESGMSPRELAEKYSCSHSSIRNRLIEAGVQTRKYTMTKIRVSIKQDRNEKVAEMYHQQGKTLQEVGDEFGLSRERVRQILNNEPRGTWAKDLPVDQIISEYESGMSLKALGEKYGVNLKTIARRLKEAGVQIRKRGDQKRELSTEDKRAVLVEMFGGDTADKLIENFESENSNTYVLHRVNVDLPIDQIISDYESGMSTRQLAKKYGVGKTTIKRRLVKAGVQIRASSKKVLLMEQIISDYESGMSTRQLAKKYGVSETTIRTRLIEAGVQIRTHEKRTRIELPMEKIWFEYESGMSMVALGEKYGVSDNTIRTRLKEMELIY